MPLAPLHSILAEVTTRRGAVLGMVCLGWEDAAEFVAAGEAEGVPVVLQVGPAARRAIPIPVWGAMLRALGEPAGVPVVAHLDHGISLDECAAAIDAGFTSVMIDGSPLPLRQNIALTNEVARRARPHGVSVEAEVGLVGYATGAASEMTEPDEAAAFARETECDCLAVSVGNVHLTQSQSTPLDWDRLAAIRAGVRQPLVLHGGSGVPASDRARAITEFGVAKINLGTEIRQAYGAALRSALQNPALYDRLAIAREVRTARAPIIRSALARAWSPVAPS